MNSNTQVQLSETKVRILSIPREDYWIFSSAILRLLNQANAVPNHNSSSDSDYDNADDDDDDNETDSDDNYNGGNGSVEVKDDAESESSSLSDWSASSKKQALHSHNTNGVSGTKLENSVRDLHIETPEPEEEFSHVAFTPNECTVIFSEKYTEFFHEAINTGLKLGKDIKFFPHAFYLLEIAGDGMNIGKRVLNITEPLSKKGISLFFLSNYFSDVVLVPDFAREKVIEIFESRGWQFANTSKSYNAVGSLDSESRAEEVIEEEKDDEEEEQEAVDDVLKRFDTVPKVSSSIKLLLTGARSNDSQSVVDNVILAMTLNPASDGVDKFPKFFSITKTLQDEIALLLPKNYRKFFKLQARNLVGSLDESMIPIQIDLFKLPIDSKGIVSGIAQRLIAKFDELERGDDCEMSYLSMGRSSVVMIPIENIGIVNDSSVFGR